MTPTEFNEYLSTFDQIMIFPEYVKRINMMSYNIDPNIIDDYLFMYGKIKPCNNTKQLYRYNSIIGIGGIYGLIRKYRFKAYTDYDVENGEYMLSPSAYYRVIFASNDADLISQFNKLFVYEDKYRKYIRMKEQ